MLQREIDPEIRADIEKFEEQLARYLSATSRRTSSGSSA